MIVKPTFTQLSRGRYNRYAMVQATAKGARLITDEYVRERNIAERLIVSKETDKPVSEIVTKEFCDEKAVRSSIDRINDGEFVIRNAPNANGTIDSDKELHRN